MSTARYLYQRYLDWTASGLKRSVLEEAMLLGLALLLSVILNHLIFTRRISSAPLNWLVTILAFFGCLQVPLDRFQLGRIERGWIFAICLIGLLSLPHALSFYLCRTQGSRKNISLLLYAIVLGLFIADFFRR